MTGVANPGSARPVELDARRSLPIMVLFTLAAFGGASLLFVVQPMIARMLLPSFGGSSTVWSTSSLFFQVLLLLGYMYAHWSTARLGQAWQPRLHLLVLLIPLVFLPIALPEDAAPSPDASPIWWLLRTLFLVVGLPFLVISTTGPLLQRWYSWTDCYRSDDPYFLFAASNLGSFIGLLSYPLIIEPFLSLDGQRLLWSVGFAVCAVLTACCGFVASRAQMQPTHMERLDLAGLERPHVVRWLAWSFLPSGLMLAVTSHITTDVAAIPLLWVFPLAIYLATFVAAFARTSREPPVMATRIAVGMGFAAAVGSVLPVGLPVPQIVLQLVMLAAVGYAVHARLAADRPDPAHLTAYYLVIATGGALGGVLNGLIAPAVFDRVLEYPLIMIAIPMLMVGLPRTTITDEDRQKIARKIRLFLVGLTAGVACFFLIYLVSGDSWWLVWPLITLISAGLGIRLAREPKLLIATLVVIFGGITIVEQVRALEMSRTFYGSYQVVKSDGKHVLVHGTTVHGAQRLGDESMEPTMYYVQNGPLGDIFRSGQFHDIGVIGLGAGGIAAYGEPGMSMTFYEIDPEVVRLAEDPDLFTYLRDSAARIRTVAGDGRLELGAEPEGSFDLIILDAFSSDAIPIHLLTVEAMEAYASKLRPGGVLLVHISSRVFDLGPVIAGASEALGWPGLEKSGGSGEEAIRSRWAVMTESDQILTTLSQEHAWTAMPEDSVTWTDNYSSILEVIRW